MRIRSQKQLYFKRQSKEINKTEELSVMGKILESLPCYEDILEQVGKDLSTKAVPMQQGRRGMTAEQVLRSLIVQMRKGYSYRELSHATEDSISVREFLGLSSFSQDKGFHYKTLQMNIKRIKESTLELLNVAIKKHAKTEGIEDGKELRTDGFNTESNIHYPTDWSLMNDSIRVLSRIMCYVYEDMNIDIKFTNHYRASKKKLFKINNDKSPKRRKKLNLELIKLTKSTLSYAEQSLVVIEKKQEGSTIKHKTCLESPIALLNHFIPLVKNVIEQAERRIVKGEKLTAEEKIFSIFEEHTDIISKGNRNIIFGHKNTITTGKSGLILGITTHNGNPADSTLVQEVINEQIEFYNSIPMSVVFDGCYSSNENRQFAENKEIQNICFSKETDQESSCSKPVRKKLRNFRAGIEATVSMLMRMFGLTRIMNKGLRSFKATVKSAVISYNLFLLARIKLST